MPNVALMRCGYEQSDTFWQHEGNAMVPVTRNYARAPIVEAIIEILFSTEIDNDGISKISRRFAERYPIEQRLTDLTVRLSGQNLNASTKSKGVRRASNDRTELVVLTNSSFLVSQLSPYCGWSSLKDRLAEAWDQWKRSIGYRKIEQVRMRYINRMDIPVAELNIETYLRIAPVMPPELTDMDAFTMQVGIPLDNCLKATISTASVPSPLVDHLSLLLDIDLSQESDIPQSDDGLFALLDKMRERKNMIFEACITDTARELFQ